MVNNYTFELPNDFRNSHSHYTEGDYYTYYRLDTITKTDTTRLTLNCGSMLKLPHLSDSTYIVKQTSDRERSGMRTNGRYWREINLPREINIFYQDAIVEERELLNDVIAKLLEQIETGR